MTKWIKDADTGELFPLPDDFYYDIPEHLKTAECNHMDYEKTTKTIIDELQSQLTAAQNHIEAIENEKTSDNNSTVTVNEVSPEIVSKSGFMDFWNEFYPIIILIVVCLTVSAFGIFVFKDEIIQGLSNSPKYQTVAEQELEEKQSETEDKSPISILLPSAFSVLLIRHSIRFIRSTIDGA